MKGIIRFVIPSALMLWGFALLPELRAGFHFVSGRDVPGVYISVAMIPLLMPAGLFAIISPRWGGMALAVIGLLGVLGTLLTPTFYHRLIHVGLGPIMFLIACADGLFLSRTFSDQVKRN